MNAEDITLQKIRKRLQRSIKDSKVQKDANGVFLKIPDMYGTCEAREAKLDIKGYGVSVEKAMCTDTVYPILDKYREMHKSFMDFSADGVLAFPVEKRKYLVVSGFGPQVNRLSY
jgi:hypothetical protein